MIKKQVDDRREGSIKKGKVPTVDSITHQCKRILSRPYMARIIRTHIEAGKDRLPEFEYEIDTEELDTIGDTYLGKTLLVTNRCEWDNERVIRAYRSQYIVEGIFKEMKDRSTGSWWPLYHWTDSKIKVHGLYCTIALLLRAVLLRRLYTAHIRLSMNRMLTELKDVREVVTVYRNTQGKKRRTQQQSMLTKLNEVQKSIMHVLQLKHKPIVLG